MAWHQNSVECLNVSLFELIQPANDFWTSIYNAWTWRHQIEGFSALLALCAGNSPVTGEFPSQRPVTRNFNVFFDQRLNKRLWKQSRPWWFVTPSHSLWRHCNGRRYVYASHIYVKYLKSVYIDLTYLCYLTRIHDCKRWCLFNIFDMQPKYTKIAYIVFKSAPAWIIDQGPVYVAAVEQGHWLRPSSAMDWKRDQIFTL